MKKFQGKIILTLCHFSLIQVLYMAPFYNKCFKTSILSYSNPVINCNIGSMEKALIIQL